MNGRDLVLAKYIGFDGMNGFRKGRVYKLKYEYKAGLLILSTPKGILQFVCERDQVFKQNWRVMK